MKHERLGDQGTRSLASAFGARAKVLRTCPVPRNGIITHLAAWCRCVAVVRPLVSVVDVGRGVTALYLPFYDVGAVLAR